MNTARFFTTVLAGPYEQPLINWDGLPSHVNTPIFFFKAFGGKARAR